MKVVLDTNVVVSGIYFSGPPYQILSAWQQGKLSLFVSREILDEYRRVGRELARLRPQIDFSLMMAYLARHARLCRPKSLPRRVCADPDDDKFISCALEAGAGVVVSGDKHLLDVTGVFGIEVVKPRVFCDKYLSRT